MLQSLIQETLEREFTQFLGAAPFERSAMRRGLRNGRRTRRLLTRVGPVELRVPRDRAGRFQPSLFARYQRSEQALVFALIEMYLKGISTRKVSAVVEQLCGATCCVREMTVEPTRSACAPDASGRGAGAVGAERSHPISGASRASTTARRLTLEHIPNPAFLRLGMVPSFPSIVERLQITRGMRGASAVQFHD